MSLQISLQKLQDRGAIPLDEKARTQLMEVYQSLRLPEMLAQLAEECAELSQAALKLRRVYKGLTPVSEVEAAEQLTEEAADVLILLDILRMADVLDMDAVLDTALFKADRWHRRTFLEG